MELSFNDLKKRDVINVPDGRCLGRVNDLRFTFPEGKLVGITVPGRKGKRFLAWFDKTEIYIDRSRIIKIGGDVILVDISTNRAPKPCPPCPPKGCPPPCPPNPPQYPHGGYSPRNNNEDDMDFTIFPQNGGRMDESDY